MNESQSPSLWSRCNYEGVLVLGVEHIDGQYTGTPRGSSELSSGDTLLLYGRRAVIEQLDERERDCKGAWQRLQSVAEQKEIEAAEESQRERTHDIELMSVAKACPVSSVIRFAEMPISTLPETNTS